MNKIVILKSEISIYSDRYVKNRRDKNALNNEIIVNQVSFLKLSSQQNAGSGQGFVGNLN